MKFHPVICSILLAACVVPSSAQGNRNGQNKNKSPNGLKAKNCNGRGKCEVEMGDFDIENHNSVLELEVKGDGKVLRCEHKPGKPWNGKGKSWQGSCSGGGTANFIKTNKGVMAGSVVDLETDEVCQIRANENSKKYEVDCKKSSEFPDEADPVEEDGLESPESYDLTRHLGEEGQANRKNQKQTMLSSNSHLRGKNYFGIEDDHRRLADDLGGNLDVMVLWTTKAECKNSGFAEGCTLTNSTTNNMESLIELAISETNTAYGLSGVDTQLRLVHSYRQENYVENGFSPVLNSITGTNDGVLDDVHQKRTTYGADIVAIIIDDPQYCGIAWLGPSKSNMFSVTAWNCATGYYSFGHEIGHNMGCNHDKGTSNACTNTNYNYGYRDPQAEFRSILAYNCNSGQCDNNAGGGCTRVQRFSNPTFPYNGKAIGTAEHNNARRINDVKATIAGYYPVNPACDTDSDCDDGDACTINTCNDGACVFEPITCDDGNFCNGLETCVNGSCQITVPPPNCDDGNYCNGEETCSSVANQCVPGTPPSGCCGNGQCEADETESSCPEDCATTGELESTYSQNNGSNGNMFKIEALKKIKVNSLDIHSSSTGPINVKVWTKVGQYTTSSAGWNLIQETSVVGQGSGNRTPLPAFTTPVTLEAGQIQSFYVASPEGVRYTNGAAEGNVHSQNSEIKFFEGIGVPGEFGGSFSPRVWNGVILYSIPSTSPTAAPVTPPTAAPVTPPTAAPVSPPTAAPVTPPTAAPVTAAPVTPPTAAPVTSSPTPNPTAAPVTPPTAAPVTASPTPNPTAAPVPPPTAAPVPPPTAAPVPPPTAAPITPPTAAPITPPTAPAPCEELCCFPLEEGGTGGWANSYMLGQCAASGCHYTTWSNGSPYCGGSNYYYICMEENCGVPAPTAAPVAPITPPTAAPVAPITPPTAAPITPPTAAPITPPTAAPITPPTAAPITSVCTGLDVKLDLQTDGYGSETSWELKDYVSVVASNSGYASDTFFNIDLGCHPIDTNQFERYEFIIKDSFGDGICCGYGEGGYSLKVNGETLLEGGNFGSVENIKFPVDPNPPTPAPVAPGNTKLFKLELQTDYWGYETSWTLNAPNINIQKPTYTYTDSNLYTEEYELPANECYAFTMSDSYGDGIYYGWYKLFWDNAEIHYIVGNFGSTKEDLIGDNCPSNNSPIMSGNVEIRPRPSKDNKGNGNNGNGNNKDKGNEGKFNKGNKFGTGK